MSETNAWAFGLFGRNKFHSRPLEGVLNFPEALGGTSNLPLRELKTSHRCNAHRRSFCKIKLAPTKQGPTGPHFAKKYHM